MIAKHEGDNRIQSEIERLDPEGRYVQLDADSHAVRYSTDIIQHREIHSYEGEEEPARAFLVAWLCTEGGYLPANIELEKEYSIGRPKVGGRLDILLKHPTGTPYALIEVKGPEEFESEQDKYIEGQLFNIAPLELGCSVLCFTTVESFDDTVIPRAKTIAYGEVLVAWFTVVDGYFSRVWTASRPVCERVTT